MMLTPQARRLTAAAVRALPDTKAREKWHAWEARVSSSELPYDVAAIVLDALNMAASELEKRLEAASLDEDTEADTLNELGYIHAIQKTLRREGVGR